MPKDHQGNTVNSEALVRLVPTLPTPLILRRTPANLSSLAPRQGLSGLRGAVITSLPSGGYASNVWRGTLIPQVCRGGEGCKAIPSSSSVKNPGLQAYIYLFSFTRRKAYSTLYWTIKSRWLRRRGSLRHALEQQLPSGAGLLPPNNMTFHT